MSFSKSLGIILSMPKTISFNLRAFPLSIAVKLPVLVYYKVQIVNIHKGIIVFPNGAKTFMVRMGYGGSKSVIEHNHSIINLRKGHVRFEGIAGFAAGFSLDCCGELTFGKEFSCNRNAFISCSKEVRFGEKVMFGDNVTVRDSDGHTVYVNGEPKVSQRPIVIGNHVWIASHAHVLKGSTVANGSIVAYRALVTRKFSEENALITGNPAEVKQTGISWGRFIQ